MGNNVGYILIGAYGWGGGEFVCETQFLFVFFFYFLIVLTAIGTVSTL